MQSSDWNISTKHIGVGRVRWRVYSVTLSRSLSYQGCKPGPSAFKAHAFCFLPWPETSPSIFLNFSSALRTSFQNPLETTLAFQRDTNNYLLREKLLDLHALAQTLSVPQLFNLEGINGLERARTCFPGGEKPGHASASLSSQPHFFSVTSSWSPQDSFWGRWHRPAPGRTGILCSQPGQQPLPRGAQKWPVLCELQQHWARRRVWLGLIPYWAQHHWTFQKIFLSFSSHPIGFHFNLKTHREGQLEQLSLGGSPLRAINHTAATEEKKEGSWETWPILISFAPSVCEGCEGEVGKGRNFHSTPAWVFIMKCFHHDAEVCFRKTRFCLMWIGCQYGPKWIIINDNHLDALYMGQNTALSPWLSLFHVILKTKPHEVGAIVITIL